VKGRRKPARRGKVAGAVTGIDDPALSALALAQAMCQTGCPRCKPWPAQAGAGERHSSTEGVLAPGKQPRLTTRRWRPNLAAYRADSTEKVEPSRPTDEVGSGRAATEGARGYATSSARGRKHCRRETQRGGAPIEAPPGPRGVPSRVSSETSVTGDGLEVVAMLKLEGRRQAKLHLRIRARPWAGRGSARGTRPQGPAQRALRNRTVRRVLVS